MESTLDYHTAKALLDWQIELGADEALCEAPVDRYALVTPAKAASPRAGGPTAVSAPQKPPEVDPVEVAQFAATAAKDLASLAAAMAAFDQCELKKGARQLVFAAGFPGARVMIIGEAPGRDDDRAGTPFAGAEGALLDKMLAAIGLDRASQNTSDAVYLTQVLPWRPPQNMEPRAQDIAMMIPFLKQHVALANPDFLVLMGNVSCQAALGQRGVSRLRGSWSEAFEKPAIVMYSPADLLRTPRFKREAWADLLSLKAKLGTQG